MVQNRPARLRKQALRQIACKARANRAQNQACLGYAEVQPSFAADFKSACKGTKKYAKQQAKVLKIIKMFGQLVESDTGVTPGQVPVIVTLLSREEIQRQLNLVTFVFIGK